MTINTSGEWWTGTEYSDIASYLQELEPGGYPVDRVVQAKCSCGGTSFFLNLDQDDELGQTICAACGTGTFVADSGKHWGKAEAAIIRCPCKAQMFEVGMGLSIRDNEWIRWGSLGTRCLKCGVLASPLDWKSDLDLSDPDAFRIASGATTGEGTGAV